MRSAARLVFVAGAVALGLFLFRSAPREVTLVYGLPPGPAVTSLEVDIRRAGEEVRHAEFRFPGGAPATVRHEVRLPDGSYELRARLGAGGRPAETLERDFTVAESGPIVLPLGGRSAPEAR